VNKPAPGLNAKAVVTHVVDGDTVDVELRIDARIRLLDCWAPETRTTDEAEKRRGLAAKANLESLCAGEACTVAIPFANASSVADMLTLNRILGRIWMDGQGFDLSSQQVLAGHAASEKCGKVGA